MKQFIYVIMLGLTVSPLLAHSAVTVKALSCSGLGLTNGYTSIQYLGQDTVVINSLKYFIQTSNAAKIVQGRIDRKSGDLTLQFVTQKHKSTFLLKIYNGSSRGDLITSEGTDILTCTSYFGIN